jgi:hypothetical protein
MIGQVIQIHLLIQGYYSLIQAIFMLEVNPLEAFEGKEKYGEFVQLTEQFKKFMDE